MMFGSKVKFNYEIKIKLLLKFLVILYRINGSV